MFDIGFSELMVVGVLGLIILGPERLPKAARTVGLMVGKIRRTMSGIQQEIEQEVRNQEIREKLKDPLQTFTQDEPESKQENEEETDPQMDPKVIQSQIDAMHAHHPQGEKAVAEDQVQQDK